MKLKIKTGDAVVVISGKDKGKTGRVLRVDRDKLRILVENVNVQTKHEKPRQKDQPGKIVKREGAIHYSNVMLLNPATGKGERVGVKTVPEGSKKRKIRLYKKSKTEVVSDVKT